MFLEHLGTYVQRPRGCPVGAQPSSALLPGGTSHHQGSHQSSEKLKSHHTSQAGMRTKSECDPDKIRMKSACHADAAARGWHADEMRNVDAAGHSSDGGMRAGAGQTADGQLQPIAVGA